MKAHPASQKQDILVLILWPIIASALSFVVQANTLASTLLFFGIPAAYLSIRNQHCIRMALLFSILFSIPFAFILDYIMEITGGWYIPHSVFDPFRLLGYVSIEQLIWLFLYTYLVVMFYETFLDKQCTHRLYTPRLKYLVMGLVVAASGFIIIHLTKHSLLEIPYFYLIFGIILGLAPLLFVITRFPRLYGPLFITGAYFFYHSFIYEVTALSLGQWTFPSENQFIGFITIAGTRFPLEEFFFWILLGSMAVVAYYFMFGEAKKPAARKL